MPLKDIIGRDKEIKLLHQIWRAVFYRPYYYYWLKANGMVRRSYSFYSNIKEFIYLSIK